MNIVIARMQKAVDEERPDESAHASVWHEATSPKGYEKQWLSFVAKLHPPNRTNNLMSSTSATTKIK